MANYLLLLKTQTCILGAYCNLKLALNSLSAVRPLLIRPVSSQPSHPFNSISPLLCPLLGWGANPPSLTLFDVTSSWCAVKEGRGRRGCWDPQWKPLKRGPGSTAVTGEKKGGVRTTRATALGVKESAFTLSVIHWTSSKVHSSWPCWLIHLAKWSLPSFSFSGSLSLLSE